MSDTPETNEVTTDLTEDQTPSFTDLGLPSSVQKVLDEMGYKKPSPIQEQSIPPLLEGKDVLGLAQTGTGKTAAFALPILSRTDAKSRTPQVLVLAPTRELAMQVATACEEYSKYTPGLKVAAVYGGQDYGTQIRAIRGGAQWIVGTPGRIMDHLKKGTLTLTDIKAVILDEADEMLRMGFIDDVDWILGHAPKERQVALFSATMPRQIKQIASTHLNNPVEIKIEAKTATASTIEQRYWFVGGAHKNDALLRITEVEDCDATMVFVRTKQATEEVADFMKANGVKCEALNGDIPQAQRERVVEKLKRGKVDMIVATDVAARGLDVERISHVINYDIPFDAESYVHRIGRTGRAGRSGKAILFVRGRERRMLSTIERTTRQRIEEMTLPTAKDVNAKRRERFKEKVAATIGNEQAAMFKEMISELVEEKELDVVEVASALAHLAQNGIPLFLNENERARQPRERREREDRGDRPQRERGPRKDARDVSTKALPLKDSPDVDMVRFRMEVGYQDGVKPGNIVGAIANEADLESKFIGHIEIFDDFSMVDLPDGMPDAVMTKLKGTRICGQPLHLQVAEGAKPVNRKPPRGRQGGDRRPGGRRDGGQRRDGGRGQGREGQRRNDGGNRRPRRDES
jgi:ATP-dependent RNA helicase DeaD